MIKASDPEAQAENAQETPWWEIVTGIIAVPAAILGLVVSFNLNRKMRLESRLKELEIREKESQLAAIPEDHDRAITEIIQPVVAAQQVHFVILRFILLFVTLQLWNIASSALGFAFMASDIVAKNLQYDNVAGNLVFSLGSMFTIVVRWVIVLVIGWPMFRDVCTLLVLTLHKCFSLGPRAKVWKSRDAHYQRPSKSGKNGHL